jgi:hypothetical protein
MDKQGACTAMDPAMAYNVCQPPTKSSAITTTEATVSVLFTDFSGGTPTATRRPKAGSRSPVVPTLDRDRRGVRG